MAERLPDESMSRNAGWGMYLTLYQDSKRTVPFALTGYEALCQFRAVEGDPTSDLLATATIVIGTLDAQKNFSADPDGDTLYLSLTAAEIAAAAIDGVEVNEMFADVLVRPVGGESDRVAYFRAVIGDGESEWPT
ncbi:MAG: hypothetical protein FDZ69_07430 [Deltaproteobacteria bacterium]|nr:MAG: hypothetical protein FDZ69_07430 [Deltaproteobacteria bacterium]